MLEDYSFKYIEQLFSKRVDYEELHIKEFFNYFTKIDAIKSKYILEEMELSETTGLDDNPYIPDKFKKTLSQFKTHHSYRVKFDDCTIQIIIHCSHENIDELLKHVIYILGFMINMDRNKRQSFTLHLYLSDYKKVIYGDDFTPENINSGSTSGRDILVWRKEDILKVIIHEIIHMMGFDEVDDTPELLQHYNDRYDMKNENINIYEAYTEIWALLIHSYYLAISTNSSTKNNSCKELFFDYVLIEKHWSNELAGKLLGRISASANVNKRTNTLSYYLIKTEILNDLKGFLKICKSPSLHIRPKNKKTLSTYLKGLSKLTKIEGSQEGISSTMIISSLKIEY
jgi:hypothetical protein|tara:strand:- start:4984 stop:6009 length:1026 start_codon:yes stop_codon:yes gene_type:complete